MTDITKDLFPEPPELAELVRLASSLPPNYQERMLPLLRQLKSLMVLQKKLVQIARDAVDQLKLDVRYLLFDIDATRRERDELREILEEFEGLEGEQWEGDS